MRILIFILFILIGCEDKKDLVLIFEDRSPLSERPREKTYFLSEGKMRADIYLPAMEGAPLSLFYQKKDNQLVMVIHPLKQIVRNPEIDQNMMGDVLEIGVTPKKTGKKKKIAGLDCEEVTALQAKVKIMEGCLLSYSQLGMTEAENAVFQGFTNRLNALVGSPEVGLEGILIENKSFDEEGKLVMHSVLKSLDRRSGEKDRFEFPLGYKVQKP